MFLPSLTLLLYRLIDKTAHRRFMPMFANIDVNFFPYSGETATGVACGLNNIQKVRDGEPLSGRASAKAVFSVLEDEDDDDFGL